MHPLDPNFDDAKTIKEMVASMYRGLIRPWRVSYFVFVIPNRTLSKSGCDHDTNTKRTRTDNETKTTRKRSKPLVVSCSQSLFDSVQLGVTVTKTN